MGKYVRETKAGKSIGAKVVLNKRGEYVATIQSHYSDAGAVLVNVWQAPDAYKACERARCKGVTFTASENEFSRVAHDNFAFQAGRAGGYGYDKFAAALSGLLIDGHEMGDHCSRQGAPKPPRGRKLYPSDATAPPGFHYSNYVSAEKSPDGQAGYSDCYRETGLKFLEKIGYRVIDAI